MNLGINPIGCDIITIIWSYANSPLQQFSTGDVFIMICVPILVINPLFRILRPSKVKEIWSPDLYIWNRTSVKSKDEWALLKTSKILTHEIKEEDKEDQTTVELKYEIKTTIYCRFEFSKYPMDSQNCSIEIGSGSNAAIFVLYEKDKLSHDSTSYSVVGLTLNIEFFGNNAKGNTIGFNIHMNRLLSPFLMKYYIPSIAIVIVAEISFMVPLTAIPGRVALLVTQFLTLVNLFIYQMVSKFHKMIDQIVFYYEKRILIPN